MIYTVCGQLSQKSEGFVVIEAHGLGYQVLVSDLDMVRLPSVGEQAKVFTHFYVREDQQLLFGFVTEQDRNLFGILTSVSGIGPRLGLKILSNITPSQLVQALLKEDLVTLTSISGVGKKMAERMIIELRNKLPDVYTLDISETAPNAPPALGSLGDDIQAAMKTLGYSHDEIKKALTKSASKLTGDHSLEDGLKIILKNI